MLTLFDVESSIWEYAIKSEHHYLLLSVSKQQLISVFGPIFFF